MSIFMQVAIAAVIAYSGISYFSEPVYLDLDLLDKPAEYATELKGNKYQEIIRLHNKKGEFFCTAFVIDDNYALTAGHCIQEIGHFSGLTLKSEEIKIFSLTGVDTEVLASPAGHNPRLDWGIIRADFSEFTKVVIDETYLPTMGQEQLVACGFPMGKKEMFCTFIYPQTMMGFHVASSGALFPGMSGGPIFEVTTGKVVGIVSYAAAGYVGYAPLMGISASFGIEK